uniref:FBD domain-containing protein n=1 Tax=Arundo donax TaxID=35708 RepID=A0A0A9F0M1_ARUDO
MQPLPNQIYIISLQTYARNYVIYISTSVILASIRYSKLNVLEFAHCSFARVELFCLPKLEQLICGFWLSECLPLTLGGYVPCLKEVEIYSTISPHQERFKLRELLCGTTCINTLSLDFLGQKIWLQLEKYQLSSAFCNLRELCLYDIFSGFGLLWTTALLEAAPSLEKHEVEVYEHQCDDEEEIKQIYAERTNVTWEVSEFEHLALKELELVGFNATEEHIVFIGAVMERASNLQAVVLKEKYCKDCSSAVSTPSGERRFPKNEDEQEMVVNNLRNRFSSRAQIMFIRDYKLSSN